ncbi:fumarylacetoacetate hydrolase family protein [Nocardia sp. NPDC049707]|uniref:fumarylacetoacetate hydrolase family protein n=1 Tax=Nocardia sp. NPDC049707 TaxID=3154735 RepID=UPI0034412FE7
MAITLDKEGHERAFDLSPIVDDIDGAFLAADGVDRVRKGLDNNVFDEIEWPTPQRIGSPVARPANIICIGMNYAAHAAESGAEPPTTPVVFLKPSNTIAGPYDAAPIPPQSEQYDWEVELGIIMGSSAQYLASIEDAKQAVAGYVMANDLSERDYQLNGPAGQWTKGKSLPSSTPVGPWFVPADQVDPNALRLRTWVNGELRQDSSTADLIFDTATIVHHLSQYMLLEPGDLILTGTPEGVALSGRFPYLDDGDIVEMEIDELGRQRQQFFRATTATAEEK